MSIAACPAFLEERSVFVREKRNGLYGPASYALAQVSINSDLNHFTQRSKSIAHLSLYSLSTLQTLITLPFMFICTFLFAVICYWSIGLNPGGAHFFKFLAFLFLGITAAEFQTLLVAAIIPIFIAALAISAFAFGFWMTVQGYFIRNLPTWCYYWAHFIDFETFSFQLLVKNVSSNSPVDFETRYCS